MTSQEITQGISTGPQIGVDGLITGNLNQIPQRPMYLRRKGLGPPSPFHRHIGLGCLRQARYDCGSGGICRSFDRGSHGKQLLIKVSSKTAMHVSFEHEVLLIFQL